ncbi:MAG: helix-turn-helix transcriptional regulator [Pseudomonadota bacterium]
MPALDAFDPDLAFEAMEAAERPDFGDWFLNAAQRFSHVEEIYAYRYTRGGGPSALISTGAKQASERAALYANRYHPYDPMLQGAKDDSGGAFFHVEARHINNRAYRHHCFEAPRFVDKLSFRWRRPQDAYYISFYRSRASAADKLQSLANLAEIGLTSLAKHQAPKSAAPIAQRLEAKLKAAYPVLSQREAEIAAKTLAGQSASQIAETLSISPASVLTYRQRAYAKYGFTSANDFLDGLV